MNADVDYTLDDGKYLIDLARKSIIHYLTFEKLLDIPKDYPPKYKENSGIFVTLRKHTNGEKNLRGCIGFPLPVYPLIRATIEAAKSSAVGDPRFPRVSLEELKFISIEISILTPPKIIEVNEPKEYLNKIKIGRDGLIVKRRGSSGLLLPQVPVEHGWSVEEFLEHTCQKAWLPKDSWKDKNVEIQKFSGIIYEEIEPNGEVKHKET